MQLQRRAEEEFARESAMVDEVVARIQAEDRMEYEARRAKQAETKVCTCINDGLHSSTAHIFLQLLRHCLQCTDA